MVCIDDGSIFSWSLFDQGCLIKRRYLVMWQVVPPVMSRKNDFSESVLEVCIARTDPGGKYQKKDS